MIASLLVVSRKSQSEVKDGVNINKEGEERRKREKEERKRKKKEEEVDLEDSGWHRNAIRARHRHDN
jgi:hypothetical protein